MFVEAKVTVDRNPKKPSVAALVRDRVVMGSKGTIWIYEDFLDLDFSAVAATLSRLARKGILIRVRPGIYYYPKKTLLGYTKPPTKEVIEALVRRGHLSTVSSGADILNKLKITDQVSNVYTVAAERHALFKSISGVEIKVLKRPIDRQEGITSYERAVLDACRNIKKIPNTYPENVLSRIKELIITETIEVDRLLKYAHHEPPRVRAIIGAIAEDLEVEGLSVNKSLIKSLKASLNPLSSYRMSSEAKKVLKTALSWNII